MIHGIISRVLYKLVGLLDVAYMTLQYKSIQEIYGPLQQFSEISDYKINKISKRAVQDFKGVANPSMQLTHLNT